jgi:hypothetical protein
LAVIERLLAVALQEVIGVLSRLAAGGAARIAEFRVLHLHDIGFRNQVSGA